LSAVINYLLIHDRTQDETKSLHGIWNSPSENIRLPYILPLHSHSYNVIKFKMRHLLLNQWNFFILWINPFYQWNISIPYKLSDTMARSYTALRILPTINKRFWNKNFISH